MNQKIKRLFYIVLVVCMLFNTVPLHAISLMEEDSVTNEETIEGTDVSAISLYSGTGSNTQESVSIGSGSKQWTQTIVYHSNYPDGTDFTHKIIYNIKSYVTIYNVFTFFKSLEDLGFSFSEGYNAATPLWNTEKDGSGTCYSVNGNYAFNQNNQNTTTHLYAQWGKIEAPKREDLYGILRNFVNVQCISEGFGLPHDIKSFSIIGNWEDAVVGEVYEGSDDEYYCDVTLYGETYSSFYGMAPSVGTGIPHNLVTPNETKTIQLKYDKTNQKWASAGGEAKGTILATFDVTCYLGDTEEPTPDNPIENKKINLSFMKNIDATNEDYDKLRLNKDTIYNFFINLTNQETGDVINGLLNSSEGFRVTNIPIGTYIIEEQDDIWFNFGSMVLENPMEGINLQYVNGDYILTINSTLESDSTIEINVTNKPDEDRFYDSKYDAENIFILGNYNEENPSVEKVPVIVEFVEEDGNSIGTETVEVIKNSEYNVTNETKKIPNGYKPNGEPTGDPVIGIADSEKTITVPITIDVNETIMVTWIDEDGTELHKVVDIKKNEAPDGNVYSEVYHKTNPKKEADEDITYEFDKWERSEDEDGNITYTARYTATSKTPKEEKIIVTWEDGYTDNPVKIVETNKSITNEELDELYPTNLTRDGYKFIGWSEPQMDGNGNITITAKWE